MLLKRKKNGQALMEYVGLIMFVLFAFLVFQKYIVRAFVGRWKNTGDSFASGSVYDPDKTQTCIYDVRFEQGWYDRTCFEDTPCDCTSSDVRCPLERCHELYAYRCEQCIQQCVADSPECNIDN